jgi:hypothetical protein
LRDEGVDPVPGHEPFLLSQRKEKDMKNPIGSRERRWTGGVVTGVLLFLFLISPGVPRPAVSDEIRVVSGVVDLVSGRFILVSGKKYDVANVPVMSPSGKERYPVAVGRGDMVELSIQGDRVISVRDFGPILQ